MIAVPFLVGTTLAVGRRGPAGVQARLELPVTTLPEGLAVEAVVRVAADTALDAVLVSVTTAPGVAVVDGPRQRVVALRAGEEVSLSVRVRVLRWGRRAVGPVTVRAVGTGLLLGPEPVTVAAVGVRAVPVGERFAAESPMPQALAHAGSHLSPRPGEGAEFAGIRPFDRGDRPRRVNWRVSLRARELHVTSTRTERSTDVLVLLDSLHDAGRSGGVDGVASSLDVTVRAAAGIAEHYLARGDRVGLVDYGGRFRVLPPAAGRAHRTRILDWLLDTAVDTRGAETPTRLLGPRVIPPRALVLALTPLLDPRAANLLAELRRRGQAVLVVDTLPAAAVEPSRRPLRGLAERLWRLEREELLARLAEIGVPVAGWSGAGSLDAVLADVARMSAAPRALR